MTQCKQKKEKELNDPVWREESQKITTDLCNKFSECSKGQLSSIKPSLQNYFSIQMRPDQCTERNRKSRTFLLKGENPEKIKDNVRNCKEIILQLSCDEIKEGKFLQNKSCTNWKNFQEGNKID